MKTKENYQREYENYCKDHDERDEAQKKNHQQYIKEYCPFKPGEEIQIYGYSYKGKRGIITGITIFFYQDYSSSDWSQKIMSYKVHGKLINKNGKPGNNIFSFTEEDYLRQLKEEKGNDQ